MSNQQSFNEMKMKAAVQLHTRHEVKPHTVIGAEEYISRKLRSKVFAELEAEECSNLERAGISLDENTREAMIWMAIEGDTGFHFGIEYVLEALNADDIDLLDAFGQFGKYVVLSVRDGVLADFQRNRFH